MPSATATMAYPGYARARKKLENNARRAGKPGMAPIMRAFSFLVRVVLATVLLPLDLLLGDAVRTGDMTRPFTGAFGIAVAYGAFRAAEFAVGLGRASSNADDDETRHIALFRFRVRPPAALDPCRLRGVPFLSASSACAYAGTVVNVVVEPFEITHRYDDKRKRVVVDVVDLDVGFATARAFRVDGVVRAAVDVGAKKHSDVASFPYAAPLVVSEILNWRPQFAHGSKGTRVLLVGGGGGNVAAYVALERACAARAETRHRRAERGEGACDVTLLETNEALASALRVGFEGFSKVSSGVGSRGNRGRGEKKPETMANAFGGRSAFPSPEGAKNRFAIVAGDAFSFLRDARPGSLDVIVFDARRDVEAVRARGDGVDGDASNVGWGKNEDSEFSDASRAANVYRDARRALRAGGTVISVAAAPFIGPGRGGADLAVLADAMRDAFDDATNTKGKTSSVRFERVGPAVPGFAQETLVLATKTADAELAARFNYN